MVGLSGILQETGSRFFFFCQYVRIESVIPLTECKNAFVII